MSSPFVDADFEMILAAMREDFMDDARNKLEVIDGSLDAIEEQLGKYENHVLEVQRLVHSLKGSAGSFGFGSVTHIAHAMEDFMEILGSRGRIPVAECRTFLSAIQNVLDVGQEPSDEETVMMLDDLPVPQHPGAKVAAKMKGKAIILMPVGLQRKIMAQELVSFGFRVTIADSAIEVIDVSLSALPDVVVTTMQLDRISGLDVARALSVIERTSHIKVAVLTADEPESKTLLGLPDGVALIRKGPTMSKNFLGWLRANNFV